MQTLCHIKYAFYRLETCRMEYYVTHLLLPRLVIGTATIMFFNNFLLFETH